MARIPDDPTKAQVWITGQSPNQTVEFYIPRGAKGETGAVGPQGPPATPPTDTGWVPLALVAPFIDYATNAVPAIRRIGNQVQFRGAVKGLTAAPASNLVVTLPAEFRPLLNRQFSQVSSAGWSVNWQLANNGELKIVAGRDAAVSSGTWYPLPSETWWND